jgi:hypothetical protein
MISPVFLRDSRKHHSSKDVPSRISPVRHNAVSSHCEFVTFWCFQDHHYTLFGMFHLTAAQDFSCVAGHTLLTSNKIGFRGTTGNVVTRLLRMSRNNGPALSARPSFSTAMTYFIRAVRWVNPVHTVRKH